MANYKSDANMISYWLMEQAQNATAEDGTANNNDLTPGGDENPGRSSSGDCKEGLYSSIFVGGLYSKFTRTDANLSAGFPGKSSGGSQGSFTVGCWWKGDATGESWLIGKWGESFSFTLKIDASTTKAKFCLSSTGSNDVVCLGSTVLTSDGTTWYHIVGVFDTTADEFYVYVNGANDSAGGHTDFATTMYLGTADLQFGAANGHIDEAFIMSRALSSTEITEIYTYGLEGEPAVGSSTPSSTPSTTPSSTPSTTPSSTPSSTRSPSSTPSATPSATPSSTKSSTPSTTPSSTPSNTPSATPSATPSSTPSSGDVTAGTTCWGNFGGAIDETNNLAFAGEWTGTGAITGTGTTEKLELHDGDLMQTYDCINTGLNTVTIQTNKYLTGDAVTVSYRHGASWSACRGASWTEYSIPFVSLGYVQIKVENPV